MQREIAPCVKIARPGFYGFGFCHTTYPSDVNGGGNSPKVIGANFETGISMHFYKLIEVKYDVI